MSPWQGFLSRRTGIPALFALGHTMALTGLAGADTNTLAYL
jgi:hypothetical protein